MNTRAQRAPRSRRPTSAETATFPARPVLEFTIIVGLKHSTDLEQARAIVNTDLKLNIAFDAVLNRLRRLLPDQWDSLERNYRIKKEFMFNSTYLPRHD